MPAKTIAKSTQVRYRSANWTDALDSILLRVLKEQHMLGNCISGHLRKETWDDIVRTFNLQSGLSLGKNHLKNRVKVLKKFFVLYYALASRSGWSWDYDRNLPRAGSSSDWETVIAVNSMYAKCKDRPLQSYKDLEVLFGNSLGNQDIALVPEEHGSGDNDPLVSPDNVHAAHTPEVKLNKDEPTSCIIRPIRTANPPPLDLPLTLPTQPSPVGSNHIPSNPQGEYHTGEHETHSRKRRRFSPSSPCTCKATSTTDTNVFKEFLEIGKQCLQIAKELLNRERKSYSMEDCIEKLNGLENVSDEAMLATLEAIKDKDNRTIFIGLKESLLSAWIDKQLALQSRRDTI